MRSPASIVALTTSLSLFYHGALSFVPTVTRHAAERQTIVVASPQRHQPQRRQQVKRLDGRHHQQKVLHSASNWLSQFWIKPAAKSQSDAGEVALLKQQLIDAVQATERGVSTTPEQREDIDRLITQLEPFNPNAGPVSSESLSALWILKWTTEREIIFLMEKGLLGLPSGPVQQTIDVDGGTLSNTMLFGPDSVFEVSSSITPEDEGPRVNFVFEACKMKYRGFTVPLPPVGKGWFESVYLDEDFRVTRDVRGDVTVLVKSQD